MPELQAEILRINSHSADSLTITVSVENAAKDIKSLGFDILYDPDILEHIKTEGELLARYQFFGSNNIENAIRVAALDSSDENYIKAGASGVLVAFVFKVIDYGHTEIEIVNARDDIKDFQFEHAVFHTNEDNSDPDHMIYEFKQMWPALKQPWYFYHPVDIAVDRQNFVYIVDAWNDRIQKFTVDGQAVTKWGGNGSDEGLFQTPSGIAVYQDTSQTFLFVVDKYNNRIQKFTADGKFISQWGEYGSSPGFFKSPSGIAVDMDGFVYVADTDNSRIQKFTLEGRPVLGWLSGASNAVRMLSPVSVAVDRAGNIYATDKGSHQVVKFSRDGDILHSWSSWEDEVLVRPEGIAIIPIDKKEILMISDSSSNRILTFSTDGDPLKYHEDIDSRMPSSLNSPAGITADTKGRIFVADSANNRIIQVQIQPQIAISQWASQGTQNGHFVRPNGICWHDNQIWVTSGVAYGDQKNQFVQQFSQDGQFKYKWPPQNTSEKIFNIPYGIAQNDLYFYIVDSGNHRILQFGIDGKLKSKWGHEGDKPGEMSTPTGLALYNNYIFVADSGNHRIQVFDSNGNYVDEWENMENNTDQLLMPKDIAIDSHGQAFVADTGNHRIVVFSIYDEYLGKYMGDWGAYGDESGDLNTPSGLDVHPEESIVVVADTGNHRCQVFSKTGEFITSFGEKGSGAQQFNTPVQVAMDDEKNIYVTDRINNRVQKFTPITSSQGNVKAILVVGDDTYGDALFQTHANLAYRALNYQGFGKNDIYYLSSDLDLDLDDNGKNDDIDGLATNENLKQAILKWADDANHVIIYLIGHNDLYFRMNANQVLDNADLDNWMDQLQAQTNCQITFIFDACKSGNYIAAYAAPENYSRVVITSTGENENSYLIGTISFSNYFWTHIFNGYSLQTAFELAAKTTSKINQPPFMNNPQNPLMDANSNGIANETVDYSLTQMLYLGNSDNTYGKTIQILSVSDPQIVSKNEWVYLEAVVDSDMSDINYVWAVLRSPDYQAGVSETIDIEMYPGPQNLFYMEFQVSEIAGTYLVAIYAEDDMGNVSIPEFTTISVETEMERRAIIVVGETSSGNLNAYFEMTAQSIYDALIFQGYTDDSLYVMSPTTFTDGWDGFPNIDNIDYAFGPWTRGSDNQNATQDILICFLGMTDQYNFVLNTSEQLSPEYINTAFGNLEEQIPGAILTVSDTPNAWGSLKLAAQSGSDKRILIASTSADEGAVFVTENNISFSTFFWQRVINGFNVKDAFHAAKDALNILNQFQTPCLEANGDGTVNAYDDYVNAREHTIGYGIMRAQDTVIIGSVMPPIELTGSTHATIWAKNVTSTSEIDKIWAVIIPPGLRQQDSLVIDHLPQLNLNYNTSTNRYEAVYPSFNEFGEYRIAIFAQSANGMTAEPKEAIVYQTNAPDPYESSTNNATDNSSEKAQVININDESPQSHNFHDATDNDWVKFHAISGNVYHIFVNNIDIHCDPVITLYEQDGQTSIQESNTGIGNEKEEIYWNCQEDGIYYVSVHNYNTDGNGKDTGYDLRINQTATIYNGRIIGFVRIKDTDTPIVNAIVRTSVNLSDISLPSGTYRIGGHESGDTTIFAEADGFKPYSALIRVNPIESTRHDIYMTPATPLAGDLNADGAITLADAIMAGYVMTGIYTQGLSLSDVNGDSQIGLAEMIFVMSACASGK